MNHFRNSLNVIQFGNLFWELFRGTSVWEPFWETIKRKFGNCFGNHGNQLKGFQFGTYFRNYSKRLLFGNYLKGLMVGNYFGKHLRGSLGNNLKII